MINYDFSVLAVEAQQWSNTATTDTRLVWSAIIAVTRTDTDLALSQSRTLTVSGLAQLGLSSDQTQAQQQQLVSEWYSTSTNWTRAQNLLDLMA